METTTTYTLFTFSPKLSHLEQSQKLVLNHSRFNSTGLSWAKLNSRRDSSRKPSTRSSRPMTRLTTWPLWRQPRRLTTGRTWFDTCKWPERKPEILTLSQNSSTPMLRPAGNVFLDCTALPLQWRSEKQICSLFEWWKVGQLLNVLFFRSHLKIRTICPVFEW